MTDELRRLRRFITDACFWSLLLSIVFSTLSSVVCVLKYKAGMKASASMVSSGVSLGIVGLLLALVLILLFNLLRFIEWRNLGYK